MSELGVAVAVLQQEQVLLTQREDFEVWCLPGGAVDPFESASDAAVREVFEETGIRVEPTHYVGLLSKPNWGRTGSYISLFAARPLSTAFDPDPNEVKALDYFPIDALPQPLMPDHKELILAARSGATGYLWVNGIQTPTVFTDRAALYAWRDASGLSRQEAFQHLLEDMGQSFIEVVLDPKG